jgi:hypothetical protein
MQYKLIINMLDDAIQLQQRASSAKRKNRPESSSPDKLKQRNPPKTGGLGMLKNLNDSSDDSDNYSNDVPDIKEDNEEAESDGKLQKASVKDENYSMSDDGENAVEANDGYDSTPSGMKKNRQEDLSKDEDDEDEDEQVVGRPDAFEEEGEAEAEAEEIDEDEMIDVAEKIFIRMSTALIENGVSVRSAFDRHIQIAEINGQPFELIAPMGFLEGIKELGLDDLR